MRFVLPFLLCTSLFWGPVQAWAQRTKDVNQPLLITRFSFKLLTGGIVILQATLDNRSDSLNFVLDTGSGGISLDSAVVQAYRLTVLPSSRVVKGIAGNKTVGFTYNHTLHLPGLRVDSLHFHVNDYSLLSSLYGLPIHGIIGFSFLSRYIVAVNYDLHQISVYRPGNFRYPQGGWRMRTTLNALPYHAASTADLGKIRSRFLIDIGAGIALLLTQQGIADSNFLPAQKRIYNTQVEGVGGKRTMQITLVKWLKLGPYRFKNVPTYILNDEFGLTGYPLSAGLIGNEIFRRFNTYINYPASEIYLRPNTQFKEEFDYAYHGLNLYMDYGMIKVMDVIPGSPADKAGLRPEDGVLAIGTSFYPDLNLWKNLLQQAGTKVKITGMRNGKLFTALLKIERMKH